MEAPDLYTDWTFWLAVSFFFCRFFLGGCVVFWDLLVLSFFFYLISINLHNTNITWKKSHKSRHEVKSGAANRIIFKWRTLNLKKHKKIMNSNAFAKEEKKKSTLLQMNSDYIWSGLCTAERNRVRTSTESFHMDNFKESYNNLKIKRM